MKKTVLRITAIITLLLCLSSLSGCIPSLFKGINKENKSLFDFDKLKFFSGCDNSTDEDFNIDNALRKIEFSGIASLLETRNELYAIQNGKIHPESNYALIHDVNGDGFVDFMYGNGAYCFINDGIKREKNGDFQDDGTRRVTGTNHMDFNYYYYTDKDNNLYIQKSNIEGTDDKNYNCFTIYNDYFSYDGTDFSETLFSEKAKKYYSKEDIYDGPMTDYEPLKATFEYDISGKKVSEKEYNEHIKSIELKKVETKLNDFTINTFDKKYKDEIITKLHAFLREGYKYHSTVGYEGCLEEDIDNDGETEYVYLTTHFHAPWAANYTDRQPNLEQNQFFGGEGISEYTFESFLTAIVCDEQDDKLVVSAHSINTLNGGYTNFNYSDNIFKIGNGIAFVPVNDSNYTYNYEFEDIATYLTQFYCSDIALKKIDLAPFPGDEILCIYKYEDNWVLSVLSMYKNMPHILFHTSLDTSAYFTIAIKGKWYLMNYLQCLTETDGLGYEQSYSYCIFNFNDKGEKEIYDNAQVSYTDSDEKATEVSSFFNSFNAYAVMISPCYDPYKLTDIMWIQPDNTTFITNGAEFDEPEDTTTGYVNIEDPDSWLHLRTGPGTNHPKVLTNSADPESYVKQAKGSPVTILETIETDDKENPVWVKIQIEYGMQTLIGYSSKKYIKLYNE